MAPLGKAPSLKLQRALKGANHVKFDGVRDDPVARLLRLEAGRQVQGYNGCVRKDSPTLVQRELQGIGVQGN